jgi:hypothetical protein
MENPTLPTFHLNGTGAESILNEYKEVCFAVQKAMDALAKATCHPRDFYVQLEGSWEQAKAERDEMFRKLKEVQDYASAWTEHAFDRVRKVPSR